MCNHSREESDLPNERLRLDLGLLVGVAIAVSAVIAGVISTWH